MFLAVSQKKVSPEQTLHIPVSYEHFERESNTLTPKHLCTLGVNVQQNRCRYSHKIEAVRSYLQPKSAFCR